MDTNRLKALFIFVVCTTFFILPTNTFAGSPKIDYAVSVVLETGNVWKKYLIDPISKVWEPWFKPEIYTANNFKISKNSEPKVESKNEPAERVGEVLSFSTTPSGVSRVTKEEVLNWLRDLVLLQNTKTYSPQIQNETAAPSVKYYYSSGVTQGLADSLSRSVNEINSSIGGDVSALQSNSVFNTSVLSVDAVNTRVGVGTSSPTDTLSVNGAVYLSQISAPSNTSNRLYNTAGNLYWAGNLIGGASAGVWETDGTSVWRASGNVGVGTSSPYANMTIQTANGTVPFAIASSTGAPLVEFRTQQTLSSSGNEVGRGTLRLYDQVAAGNRKLELGFYEYGSGIFSSGGNGTDPFEFWIDSGILSVKGNSIATNSNRVEVRTPSDAPGVNLESGYYKGVTSNPFGGHVYYDTANYPLYFRVNDGTGFQMEPQAVWKFGGRLLNSSYLSPNVSVLAGDTGQTSAISLGRYTTGGGDVKLFHWQMASDQRFAQFGYGVNTIDTTKSLAVTDDGRFGIGLDRSTTLARLHVVSIETGVPTLLLKSVAGQTDSVLSVISSSNASLFNVSSAGNVGIGTTSPFAKLSVESTAGAAQFVVGSSTATQFIVDKNGNVGVGTSSPTEKLHVQGNLNVSLGNRIVVNTTPGMEYADGVIQANNGAFGGFIVTSSSQVYGTQFLSPSGTIAFGNSASGSEGMGFPTTQTIGFRTANVERLRIGSTGNIGVGTTTPWGLLSVNANGLTGGAPQFVVGSSTATNFIVANNGNVGVGTAAPGFLLHVNGNAMVGATVPTYIPAAPLNLVNSAGGNMKTQLNLVNTGGGNGSGSAIDFFTYDLAGGTAPGLRVAAYDNNYSADFAVLTKNPGASGNSLVERLRVTNAGNVGIGTTTPSRNLHVYKSGGQAALSIQGGLDADSAALYLGSGTAEEAALYVPASSSDLRFYLNSVDRMTLTSSGNVGIGTTTPWRTLSVNGTVAMPSLVNDSTGYYACVNTTTGQLSTSTSACGASSERFKENIQDIGYGLEEVLGLRPVSFDYKSDYIPNAPKQLGFIAEEVDLLVPELVARDSAGQIQGLDYPKFTAILAKAIQELSKKMDAAIAQMQLALTWFTSDGKLKVQNDICVDDVCVTKDQFKQLLLDSAVGATQTIDNSPQIVDDSGEEESGEVEMASSTPEIIPEETEQNASTTPETGIETPSETASTTPGTE